ncbi:hypothetical protein B0T14DRAFT_335921 [Immersiella caudata]|uniref:Uncharacterized protein n=1 Tax=Immersiella caudata TaxID=314043 RepID=A0AA39TLL9_9PEZI|nr:hypothetical protein B0T14DRAFT_335921 [Immersiella caudata]
MTRIAAQRAKDWSHAGTPRSLPMSWGGCRRARTPMRVPVRSRIAFASRPRCPSVWHVAHCCCRGPTRNPLLFGQVLSLKASTRPCQSRNGGKKCETLSCDDRGSWVLWQPADGFAVVAIGLDGRSRKPDMQSDRIWHNASLGGISCGQCVDQSGRRGRKWASARSTVPTPREQLGGRGNRRSENRDPHHSLPWLPRSRCN